MEPIRVLQVLTMMNRGGAETMIMNLYRNIDRSKLQFDFMLHWPEKGDFDDEIKDLGGRMFYVPRYSSKTCISYIKLWNRFFREHPEYRVIHGHVSSTAAIYLSLAKRYGLTTIVHSHNTSSGPGIEGMVKDILQKPLRAGITDYLFACSEAAGEWLFGRQNLSKVVVLKNSVDADKFVFDQANRERVRNELGIEQRFVVGNIGRFHEQKNHLFLIDIFNVIQARNLKAILLLVGRGYLEEQVKDKVRRLGIQDKVIFLGVRSDVADILQAMDVFLMPSLYEGLPVTVVEAQCSGLPCILADTITKEVSITDLVQFVPLNASLDEWAQAVLYYSTGISRESKYEDIAGSGYDAHTSAQWIQDFYLAEHYKNANSDLAFSDGMINDELFQ